MVVHTFSDSVSAAYGIRIEDYILEHFSAAKLPAELLQIDINDFLEINSANFNNDHGQQNCSKIVFPFARSPVAKVSISASQQLVANPEPETQIQILKLTFSIAESLPGVEFQPGDTIGILASNSEDDVDLVLRAARLEAVARNVCTVKLKPGCSRKSAKLPAHIPDATSPREIVRDCLSLRAVPKKQFLRALAECCSDSQERSFLSSLSSKEGASFYNELVLGKGYTFLDFLRLCPTCCPSLALLVEQLPRLLPRPYSIASSPMADKVNIIFSVLPEKPGVVTGMLQRMSNELARGQRPCVHLYFRESTRFRYSQDDVSSGCIMIGVGTGVAPFLGFLEHKQFLESEERKSNVAVGKTWLFCGSKSPESACGRKQFQEYKSRGILDEYYEAFSRVADSPAKYVQDLLLANCEEFVEFFIGQPKTRLYVCADGAKISKSIEAGIKQCFMQSLTMDDTESAEFIKELRNSGKYSEDFWT